VEGYWIPERGRVAEVVTTAITDNDSGLNVLQSGRLDLTYASNLLADEGRMSRLTANGFVATESAALNAHAIFLRITRGELADVRVRQALNHAIAGAEAGRVTSVRGLMIQAFRAERAPTPPLVRLPLSREGVAGLDRS
jgi:ABC-type transport system substrate-binding protein